MVALKSIFLISWIDDRRTMTKKIEAVVFDLYGTLLHVTDERKPYSRMFRRLSLSLYFNRVSRSEVRKICLTEDLPSLSDVVSRVLPKKQGFDTGKYEVDVAREVGSVELYSDTIETLDKLKGRGLKLGLVSNLASPYKEPFFRLGLDEFIQHTVFSCDVGMQKPEQGIYAEVLDMLGVPAENVLMVGDKLMDDVLGPASAGMGSLFLDRDNSTDYLRRIQTLSQLDC